MKAMDKSDGTEQHTENGEQREMHRRGARPRKRGENASLLAALLRVGHIAERLGDA